MKRLFRIAVFFSLIGIISAQTQDLQSAILNVVRGNASVETALAVGSLTVDWGVASGDPIFTILNAAPGDTEVRNVEITNGDTTSLPLGVKGLNVSASGGIENVLDFVIRRNGSDIYGGSSPTGPKTLGNFMNDSLFADGIDLGIINPSEVQQIDFEIHFQEGAGNEYQEKSVQFDLVIGVRSVIPEACSFIDMTGKFPIMGTSGNDRINGTSGDDVILGLGGKDRIFGLGGRDCIVGGAGDDEVRGETGNDVIFGDEGKDKLLGGVGDDLIFGGTEDDVVKGEAGKDTLWGEAGKDKVSGGSDADTIDGGNGDDELDGGSGEDIINGGDGEDEIDGGSGNDTLHGNNQNDELDGGAGNDTIVGDSGIDRGNGQSGVDSCNVETKKNCEL